MKTKRLLFLSIALFAARLVSAQGTTFTYQGRLVQNGTPATGLFDMRFTLHDTSGGVTQIAGPISNPTVGVTNGLFTVMLDFGSGAFNGNPRWLQIGVRTNGSASAHTLLSPRQPVTAAPYAIMAANLNGTLPDSQLSANIPRLNSNQTFTGNINLSGTGSVGIGTATPLDAKLDLEGDLRLNEFNIYLRASNDRNHGIGWRSSVGGRGIDGPFVFGFNGGALGVAGPDSPTLQWDWVGNVWISNHLDTASLNVRSGELTVANALNFGANRRQMIHLWNAEFGIGIQDFTLYQRSGNQFAWFLNGTHANGAGDPGAGGRQQMRLDGNGTLLVRDSVVVDMLGTNTGGAYPSLSFGGGETIASNRDANNVADRWGINFFTGFQRRMTIANNGNIGIGATAPQGKLDIDTGNGSVRFINDGVPGINVTGGSLPGVMRFRNALEVWPSQDGSRAGYLDVRGTDGSPTISLNGASGEATVKVLNITGGADIAEPFPMKEENVEPGSVVVIDDEHPGRLARSSRAYDSRVAGIVSGANGVNPGLALHQEGKLDGGQNVALTGRVYAFADAARGPIKPGDLLTTSDTPGHVMRVSDHARAPGAIVGKAMSALKDGKGMVLVLVNLQ